MRRVFVVVPLLLALAGCGATTAQGPTAPSVSLVDALETTTPVPSPQDARFLALLAERGVPYTGRNPAGDASIVCATLTLPDSRGFAVDSAPVADREQREEWVATSVEVYCPGLG